MKGRTVVFCAAGTALRYFELGVPSRDITRSDSILNASISSSIAAVTCVAQQQQNDLFALHVD